MKLKSGKLLSFDKSSEEMAENIANLQGQELEDYIADAREVLRFINKRLAEKNHSQKTVQAYQATKITLEDILAVIEPNRSN